MTLRSDLIHAVVVVMVVVCAAVLTVERDLSSTVMAAVLTGALGFAAGRSGTP
jgi:uncharacterized MnhB-related membrane protein